jgi:hypothetical protein
MGSFSIGSPSGQQGWIGEWKEGSQDHAEHKYQITTYIALVRCQIVIKLWMMAEFTVPKLEAVY